VRPGLAVPDFPAGMVTAHLCAPVPAAVLAPASQWGIVATAGGHEVILPHQGAAPIVENSFPPVLALPAPPPRSLSWFPASRPIPPPHEQSARESKSLDRQVPPSLLYKSTSEIFSEKCYVSFSDTPLYPPMQKISTPKTFAHV
jgi:hypothetical protein